MTRDQMKQKLERSLSPKRFIHSINVMNTAIKLAKAHGVDEEKAAIAGLLHDVARDIRGEKTFKTCQKYGIVPDYIMSSLPELVHGPLGYFVAQEEYGIADKDVLNAILCHTTGKENMTLLDKVIFLADYIEPNRTFTGVEEIRAEAFNDLNRGLLYSLERTIKYVMSRGVYIHPDTVNARNSLIREMKDSGYNKIESIVGGHDE